MLRVFRIALHLRRDKDAYPVYHVLPVFQLFLVFRARRGFHSEDECFYHEPGRNAQFPIIVIRRVLFLCRHYLVRPYQWIVFHRRGYQHRRTLHYIRTVIQPVGCPYEKFFKKQPVASHFRLRLVNSTKQVVYPFRIVLKSVLVAYH